MFSSTIMRLVIISIPRTPVFVSTPESNALAGAGATVPLTGFGYSIAKGVKEAVQEDGFLGVLTGGLKATAGGITAAILAGLIASFLFKAKDKS